MVLKNRFGDCDVEVGMNFFGGINTFHELPKPDEIFDYERYTSPNYILETLDSTEIIIDEPITQDESDNFNFVL